MFACLVLKAWRDLLDMPPVFHLQVSGGQTYLSLVNEIDAHIFISRHPQSVSIARAVLSSEAAMVITAGRSTKFSQFFGARLPHCQTPTTLIFTCKT